jgi:hypothetical protein
MAKTIAKSIQEYNDLQSSADKKICDLLKSVIEKNLSEATSKNWHGSPAWFLNDNPVVGYSKQKAGVRLMFWSGMDFDEPRLVQGTGKFKDASIFYQSSDQVDTAELTRWIEKSRKIQWDYKNIVKNRGVLNRIS